MNRLGHRFVVAAASLLCLACSQPALATFTFDGKLCADGSPSSGDQCTNKNSFQTGGTGTDLNNTVTTTGWSRPTSTGQFALTKIAVYGTSGLGVNPDNGESSSEHGIDNLQNTDAVLFSFEHSTILNSVKLGWNNNGGYDTDISVMRWVGDADGPGVTGLGTLAGWELVGSYADLGTAAARDLGNTTKGSSWWMVSAYNSTYGSAILVPKAKVNGVTPYSEFDGGDDYFKLSAVGGVLCTGGDCGGAGVPEPATLALLAMGLVGLMGTRRRAQKNDC